MLFKEVGRVKKLTLPATSVRECLWTSIAEYNKTVTNKARTLS